MSTRALSDPSWLAQLYKNLLGRAIKINNNPQKPLPNQKSMAAWYTTEDGALAGLIRLDFSLAILLGSALCLVPPATAQANSKAGKLDPLMKEDLYEALNVSSRVFQRVFDKPILIVQVVASDDPAIPEEVKPLLKTSPLRQELTLNIEGYGVGNITIACT